MSAQQKASKEALDQAVTAYNCCKKIINKSLDSADVPNERTLTNKMKYLSDALSNLNVAHTTWVSKCEFTDDQLAAETYSTTWLETEWDSVSDIQDKVEQKLTLTLPPTQTNAQKLIILRKQMETLKLDIDTNVSHLLVKTVSEVPSPKVYKDMLLNVRSSLDNDFKTLAERIMSLETVDLAGTCDEFEKFRQKQQTNLSTIQLQLAENTKSPVLPDTSSAKRGIEMEKSRAPTFSGKTIDYPEFKRGWTKVAGAVWSDENQVEQIKFKVDADTRRIISRCSTMTDVWAVLDAEFAQEQEVINAVDEQLRSLRASLGSTSEYIVKLRNHLPTLEEALKGVNGLDYLCSPDRVKFLVNKFDERTLYDWEYFRSKSSGTTYERFFKFLLDRYDAARSVIARQKSMVIASDDEDSHSYSHSVAATNITPTGCRRCQTWVARDKIHTCPGCGRGTPVGERVHHCLEHCGAYMNMTPDQRSSCVESAKWCPVHLLGTHNITECKMTNDPRFICGIDNCTKHHHKSLHGSSTTFVATINTTISTTPFFNAGENVLLTMQTLSTKTGSVNCVFDNCATCCLITRNAAEQLNLFGEHIQFGIKTVTGDKVIDSRAYLITLIDKEQKEHTITAFEGENILDNEIAVDTSEVKHLFSETIQERWKLYEERPKGEIDLLIGENVCGLHPVTMETVGHLKIKSSIFGSGHVLSGFHPDIHSQTIRWSEDVQHIRNFAPGSTYTKNVPNAVVNRISIKPMRDFFEQENLGIMPPRRCGNCLNCKECSFRGHLLSQQEQYEYQVLEANLKYDKQAKQFHVSYPFTADPSILPNNKGQVIKIAERLEKKLIE